VRLAVPVATRAGARVAVEVALAAEANRTRTTRVVTEAVVGR
jgi:hypothetical protein